MAEWRRKKREKKETDEEAIFRELMATGLECICQTTPEEIAIPLKKLIQ